MALWERKHVDPLEEAALAPLPDDEAAARESLTFKKGMIAFDIVFDRRGNPFVVEIQSTNAGASGIAEGLANDSRIPEEIKAAARKVSRRQSGYTNPIWFDELADRKDEQLPFIPESYRPRSVVSGNFDALFKYGKVIVKPLSMSQGNGIRIFDSAHMTEAVKYAEGLHKEQGGFVAQSLIESPGAELAPENLRTHAASLRLFIPFEVVNGKVTVTISNFGYQRVAPEAMPENSSETSGYDKAGVVNLSRKAHPVPMSASEYRRALPVTLAIIQNLLAKGEASAAYRRGLRQKLEQKFSDITSKFYNTYGFFYLYNSLGYGANTLDEVRAAIRFTRFVERALSLLKPTTIEKLKKRSVSVTFKHSSGANGTVEFFVPKTFSIKQPKFTFATNENPIILTRLIEDAADGRKLRK